MREIPIRKYYGVNLSEIWSPTDDWVLKTKADVVTLHGFDNPPSKLKKYLSVQNTLFLDLDKSTADLFSGIKKNFRYEIKRNINDDNIEVRIMSPEDLKKNPEIINSFRKCHHEMYKEKGINVTLTDLEIFPFIDANALWITLAQKNNEELVYHSYVDCGDSIRLFHSCSCFRADKERANLIGRCNKRLHWNDICFFKNTNNYSTYDWGGISSFDNPNGIDRFKISYCEDFESCKHTYYNGQIGVTCLGKFALRLYRIIRK